MYSHLGVRAALGGKNHRIKSESKNSRATLILRRDHIRGSN
jgi:hypothetical protein